MNWENWGGGVNWAGTYIFCVISLSPDFGLVLPWRFGIVGIAVSSGKRAVSGDLLSVFLVYLHSSVGVSLITPIPCILPEGFIPYKPVSHKSHT